MELKKKIQPKIYICFICNIDNIVPIEISKKKIIVPIVLGYFLF